MAADVASAQKASAQSTEYGDTSADLPMAAAPAVALPAWPAAARRRARRRASASPRHLAERVRSPLRRMSPVQLPNGAPRAARRPHWPPVWGTSWLHVTFCGEARLTPVGPRWARGRRHPAPWRPRRSVPGRSMPWRSVLRPSRHCLGRQRMQRLSSVLQREARQC